MSPKGAVMIVRGIDFTSRPSARKPLTCFEGRVEGGTLHFLRLHEWTSFGAFEAALASTGPWIAGIDFPFGQSRRFIENIGWPNSWPDYVEMVAGMDRRQFRSLLDSYRANRPFGDKEHRRATDIMARSISPQKLYGVPVGLMFFEGAPRLQRSTATIAGIREGDTDRIVVESYPGVLARALVGNRAYKNDTRRLQTEEQMAVRREILAKLMDGTVAMSHGIVVNAPMELADDPSGDHIDALLCAVQSAWALLMREQAFGMPPDTDPLEGWIADPALLKAKARSHDWRG